MNANNIIDAIEKARQHIRSDTEILVVSTNCARRIIQTYKGQAFPPTVLFILDNNCEDNKALALQGKLKEDMLERRDKGLIKLYTFDELRNKHVLI